jgi:integrase/recombinase XerD
VARRKRQELPEAGSGTLPGLVRAYLQWLRDRSYSEQTVESRRRHLEVLLGWCAERGLQSPSDLSRQAVELYQRHLARQLKEDGSPLATQTQRGYLITVSAFCRFLARSRLLLYNPAAELELPRQPRRIPRNVLTPEEAERVLAVPDLETPGGLRDRAMLETLYSTGMRRSELARLRIPDVDLERGLVLIREGKGKKDRMVPIGERASAWVRKYLADSRPLYLVPPDEGALFLTRFGQAFVPNGVSELVTAALKASGVGKSGSAHIFRHTAATLMLEGGADIRYIQQLLGHECLGTTQIYTRVSIRALKEVHDATHPAARLGRRRDPGPRIVLDVELDLDDDEEDDAE